MTGGGRIRRLLVIGACTALTVTGCAFQGLNSLPLPGAVGRGPGANIYHVQIANVGTLESNSPVSGFQNTSSGFDGARRTIRSTRRSVARNA